MPESTEQFKVRNTTCENILRDMGGILKNACPPGIGFALLIFEHGTDKGGMFYASNSERTSMIKAMEEFLENAKKDV